MANEFEELFESIFGYKPTKEGRAYEMLVAAVMKIVSEKSKIIHDINLKGKYSNTNYQIDTLIENNGIQHFGECKDYTERDAKVGRPDIQKLAGALRDLDVNSGQVFSATEYTNPAIKYSESSMEIIGKEIDLNTMRTSTEKDKEGRVQKIILNLIVILPNFEKADFQPVLTVESQDLLNGYIQNLIKENRINNANNISISVSEYYDKKGNPKISVSEMTRNLRFPMDIDVTIGSFILRDCYIKAFDKYFEIKGLTYMIPIERTEKIIEINAKGEAKLLVKTKDHNKLITDFDLKNVKFNDNGEVELI